MSDQPLYRDLAPWVTIVGDGETPAMFGPAADADPVQFAASEIIAWHARQRNATNRLSLSAVTRQATAHMAPPARRAVAARVEQLRGGTGSLFDLEP